MSNSIKVSVITPVFNGAEFIAECIESVQAQDYLNIEHIVIDGGSTDNTIDIVTSYGVKYISEADAGIYDAFNKGIRNASGEIIHILNADDLYADTKAVSAIVSNMTSNNLDLCHGYAEQFNDKNIVVKKIGKNVNKKELLKKMRVAHPATFVSRSVYDQFGSFSVGFKIAADHDFRVRVWDKIEIGFTPRTIVKMRIGGVSTSQFVQSYRESMACAIINGQHPFNAYMRYNYEIVKNAVFQFFK